MSNWKIIHIHAYVFILLDFKFNPGLSDAKQKNGEDEDLEIY